MQTLRLLVPSPALPDRLDRFIVANVAELSRRQVKGLIDAQQIRVDDRVERRAGRKLKHGEVVEINYRPSWRARAQDLPSLHVVKCEENWMLVDKPSGVSSHPSSDDDESSIISILEQSALPNAHQFCAVHRLDRGTSGLLVMARPHARPRLSEMFENRLIKKQYLAIVHPAPQAESGQLEGPDIDGKATHLQWTLKRRSRDGSRAELLVTPVEGRTHQVRIQLSAAGWPLVGDIEHGDPIPGGAHRLALHCCHLQSDLFDVEGPPPPDWDQLLEAPPDPPPSQKERKEDRPQRSSQAEGSKVAKRMSRDVCKLQVSRSSARILRSGHPWLIRDRWTGELNAIEPGDPAYLVDEHGEYVATAITDPSQELCARVVSTDPQLDIGHDLFATRSAEAVHARRKLLDDSQCTAIRLIHGEADGLPGLSVDLWGDVLVSTLSSAALRRMARSAYDGLRDTFGNLPLFEREHFVDLRSRDQSDAKLPGQWIWEPSGAAPSSFWVLESGLRYLVQPLEGLSSGLYPDQRSNRSLLSSLVGTQQSAEVANLFSHTGAFSVACAAAGARRVWSIDLSRTYSDIAHRNLEANGLSQEEHPVVIGDSMEWLEGSSHQFDGLILDPPSRASGKKPNKRGWSSRKDYQRLVALAARRLKPRGWMLCCSNLRGVPGGWLGRQIKAGLRDAERRLDASRTQKALPSPDFPTMPGFPEGRSFQASLVHLKD